MNISGSNVQNLTRQQLKKIMGGMMATTSSNACNCNSIDDCSNGQHCYSYTCTKGTKAGLCADPLA